VAAPDDGRFSKVDESKPSLSRTLSEQIENKTRTMEREVSNHLKQVERDFRVHLQACIDSCESMERIAQRNGREYEAIQYGLRAKIYRQILDNYSLSNSYGRE
jgi:hypothetical protein